MNRKRRVPFIVGMVAAAVVILFPAHFGYGASTPGNGASYSELKRSVEGSVALEKERVDRLGAELKALQSVKSSVSAAYNAYGIQITTYSNLLLVPSTDTRTMEKAWSDLRGALAGVQSQIEEMIPAQQAVISDLGRLESQQALVERQIAELRKLGTREKEARDLIREAESLRGLLGEKKKILKELEGIYSFRTEQLERFRASFRELSESFQQRRSESQSRQLFARRATPLSAETFRQLGDEVRSLGRDIRDLFSPGFWRDELKDLWTGAGLHLLSFPLLFMVLLLLLVRLRQSLARIEGGQQWPGYWHRLVLFVAVRSLVLAGVTLFVLLCSYLDIFFVSTPMVRLAAYLMIVALTTRWVKLMLLFWKKNGKPAPGSIFKLRELVVFVRYFAYAHLLIDWSLGGSSGLLLFGRIFYELYLIFWVYSFWRSVAAADPASWKQPSRQLSAIRIGGKALGYFIAGGAFVLDMIGYAPMAIHWQLSWGRSTVIVLWWAVFFFMIREWDRHYQDKRAKQEGDPASAEYPVQWLIIRLAQLFWMLSLVVALILAWGGRQAVLSRIYGILGHPLEVGSMSFSVLGLLYAILVLLATQAAVRLWRWIFQAKFLKPSGMDIGLQHSVTTISVYLIWAMGILLALHVFGLSTASMAVAIGALGIGLGFGLQNIFNNFISGIILLFERPIQVGDDVEVNGTWATVKKINVRSTVVQTYDNASLIIPNSEFISSQVTNWSFKDKRIRRNIYVGVAYGSDVALVRSTLLEVAQITPGVLKDPAPDVLFSDFGDSALLFRLRIWTTVDGFLQVESDIRFDIDRLFRQRDIEIAFPQQDIHIRTITADSKAGVPLAARSEPEKTAGGPD